LETLYINQNEIQELPAGLFETLTDLEELAINENELQIVHGSTFRSNKKLRKLYLYSNNIRAVAAGTFDGLNKLTLLDLENNTFINTIYKSNTANKTIDLTQVSSDLSTCYDNYESTFRTLSELAATREDLDCPTPSATPITIYASIVTILLLISIFLVIKSSSKDKNPIGQNNFTMQGRSTHYYSQAD
jgi:Leucine-rich repeat (LRR) protein